MEKKIYLILENGQVFEGKSFGAYAETVGELVFTTAMTGYLETLTDPSSYGQIVIQTFPLIGNYGVIPSDFESSKPHLKAYIVRDWCQNPSNFRSEGILDTFLKDQGIIGVYDLDVRQLTKIVRESGVMNAKISFTPKLKESEFEELRKFRIVQAVKSVSSSNYEVYGEDGKKTVVLWDFGAKDNIRRELVNRGLKVIVAPATATAEKILSYHPDGIMLSNGPGDPAENVKIVKELKKLNRAKIPTFGICLGHQLMALAEGAKTVKLKYGHRGANQPAKDLETGRVYITSQNHGYTVLSETIPANAKERFVNGNDGTCEGIDYLDMPAFTVQFHPEAAAGPLDTMFLFDKFISMINGGKSTCL